MRIAITIALFAALGAAPLLGCASKVQTVTTVTIECQPTDDLGEDYGYEEVDARECTEIRRETTVTTERDGCHGAISCSVSLVGTLVALPFRIVGVVLDAVF